jgi:hydrogenase 3 maturation protease
MEDIGNFFKEVLNKKLAVIGVGSELRGDDGVGPYLCEKLSDLNSDNFLSITGGLVPENFTSELRKFKPDLVILIDAALMDKQIGSLDIIKINESMGISFSSHSIPLSVLGKYISKYIGAEVYVLGIQACNLNFGSDISNEVKETADKIYETIKSNIKTRKY